MWYISLKLGCEMPIVLNINSYQKYKYLSHLHYIYMPQVEKLAGQIRNNLQWRTWALYIAHTHGGNAHSTRHKQITYGHLDSRRETQNSHSPIKLLPTHPPRHTHTHSGNALQFLPSFCSTAPLMSFLTWHRCFAPPHICWGPVNIVSS